MLRVLFTTLLNKIIQQRGEPLINYEILIEQTNNNECLFHVSLQYKNYTGCLKSHGTVGYFLR